MDAHNTRTVTVMRNGRRPPHARSCDRVNHRDIRAFCCDLCAGVARNV